MATSGKLIGYARVSTSDQDTDRQQQDLLDAGVRRDDLYVDHGVSGARDKRPALDQCLAALQNGDTLVVTTLDRLGRSTRHMLNLSQDLQDRGINLKVLNLGGSNVDTSTPTGRLMFTIMSAIAEMELEIKRERINDSIAKRKERGEDLGGRPQKASDAVIRQVANLIDEGMSVQKALDKVHTDYGIKIHRSSYYRRLEDLNAN